VVDSFSFPCIFKFGLIQHKQLVTHCVLPSRRRSPPRQRLERSTSKTTALQVIWLSLFNLSSWEISWLPCSKWQVRPMSTNCSWECWGPKLGQHQHLLAIAIPIDVPPLDFILTEYSTPRPPCLNITHHPILSQLHSKSDLHGISQWRPNSTAWRSETTTT
jgi:hypothetical protein